MDLVFEIKKDIDSGNIEGLYALALVDPLGFFGKLTVRQLGKKRCQVLKAKLEVLTSLQQNKDKFACLMLSKLEKDLGIGGLF